MRYTQPALLEHLASTYVLGTLRHGARRRFERLRAERGDIGLHVTEWEERLGLLAQSIPSLTPGSHVWRAIDARTRPPARSGLTGGSGGWWKLTGASLGGVLAGVALMFALVMTLPGLFLSADRVAMRTGETLPQSYVGLLTDAQGSGKLLVSSLRNGRTMTMKVIGPIAQPVAGRLMLWAVPSQGAAFLLGEVPASGSAQSRLPATSESLLAHVGKLVVTVETSERPSAPGTPVFSGNCAKLW